MKVFMTPVFMSELRRDVQECLNTKDKSIPFSKIKAHIDAKGWNTVDNAMFKEWVKSNFKDRRINFTE